MFPLMVALAAGSGQDLGLAEVPAGVRSVVEAQAAFALDLHRSLALPGTRANTVASPLSVWTALAMLAEGADGETLTELTRLLLPGAEGTPVEVLARLRAGAKE